MALYKNVNAQISYVAFYSWHLLEAWHILPISDLPLVILRF